MKQKAALVKLILFAVVTLLATLLVGVTIANVSGTSQHPYKAVFSDATGILAGDDVRIAGVRVGRVTATSVKDGHALLSLSIDNTVTLRTTSHARIRYRDLLGRRYVAITDPGNTDAGDVLPPGSTIPLAQTQGPLDLTVLFNGFKPIFATIQPKDVNALASEVVATLQGEGGTVDALLANTASLTTTLADRDAVFGRVVNNLTSVLSTVAQRDKALGQLITNLQRLSTGLAADRDVFGSSLASIDDLASATASLLHDARPSLDPDIRGLSTVLGTVASKRKELDDTLKKLPAALGALARGTSYGSWLNLYVCDFKVSVNGTDVPLNGTGASTSPRCSK